MLRFLSICVLAIFTSACAGGDKIIVPSKDEGVSLDGFLSKPEGNGTFPAVVLLHGCSGTERRTDHQTVWRGLIRHASYLNGLGFVTLIVDSFATRNVSADRSCRASSAFVRIRVLDAFGALTYLQALPYVDPNQIGVVGLSQGAAAALRTVDKYYKLDDDPGFNAVVAFYPWCAYDYASFTAPALILIGEADDWTPATQCRWLGKRKNVDVVVYPEAYHSFDLPIPGTVTYSGHTVGGNYGAYKDAQKRMGEFFALHLK